MSDGDEFPVFVPSIVHESLDLSRCCHFRLGYQIFPFHTHHNAAKPTARATAPTFGERRTLKHKPKLDIRSATNENANSHSRCVNGASPKTSAPSGSI